MDYYNQIESISKEESDSLIKLYHFIDYNGNISPIIEGKNPSDKLKKSFLKATKNIKKYSPARFKGKNIQIKKEILFHSFKAPLNHMPNISNLKNFSIA